MSQNCSVSDRKSQQEIVEHVAQQLGLRSFLQCNQKQMKAKIMYIIKRTAEIEAMKPKRETYPPQLEQLSPLEDSLVYEPFDAFIEGQMVDEIPLAVTKTEFFSTRSAVQSHSKKRQQLQESGKSEKDIKNASSKYMEQT